MSAKLNLGVGIGTFAVMLIMSLSVLYFTNQGLQQSEHNNEDIDDINKTLTTFIDQWSERVRIGNTNTNNTQQYILDGVDRILKTVEDNFNNLSAHRIVTNQTFDRLQNLINATEALTVEEYDVEAQKKVDSIIGNMTEKFDILFRGLNITETDTNTEAYEAMQKLQKQLDEIQKSIPPGQLQKLENRNRTQ